MDSSTVSNFVTPSKEIPPPKENPLSKEKSRKESSPAKESLKENSNSRDKSAKDKFSSKGVSNVIDEYAIWTTQLKDHGKWPPQKVTDPFFASVAHIFLRLNHH